MSLGKEIYESVMNEPDRWHRRGMVLKRNDGVSLFFCDLRFLRAITMKMDEPEYISFSWKWKFKIARAMKTLSERQTLSGALSWKEVDDV